MARLIQSENNTASVSSPFMHNVTHGDWYTEFYHIEIIGQINKIGSDREYETARQTGMQNAWPMSKLNRAYHA